MRLKKQYVVLIVALMLVVTALLASMMSQYAQGGRIAYVSVKTDKTSYSYGENVTFKFVPLTKDVSFSTSGTDPTYGIYYGNEPGSVHIVRIPDDVDPHRIMDDRTLLQLVDSWDNRDMTVSFDYFNSTDGEKSLSWNGTEIQYTYYDQFKTTVSYNTALGGYYLIYPQFTSLSGHAVKFQLDQNAIFHLDSLSMTFEPSYNGSAVSYNMTVSTPSSMGGSSHCKMSWKINGMNMGQNGPSVISAEFDMVSGGVHQLTASAQGVIYSDMDSFILSGWIDTSWGNFTFFRTDWYVRGGWYDSPQYYYN
jgi:hypothetical protein